MRNSLITASIAGAFALTFVAQAPAAALGLTIGTAPSFTVTLDGTDQTPTFTLDLTATSTNGAFNITASSTSFTVGTHTLVPPTVTGVLTLACTGSSCATPTNTISPYPVLLTAAAQKLYSASATAKGTNPMTVNFTLSVPGNSFGGAYVSTLTLTIVSGP
jgi:hypothetical protein